MQTERDELFLRRQCFNCDAFDFAADRLAQKSIHVGFYPALAPHYIGVDVDVNKRADFVVRLTNAASWWLNVFWNTSSRLVYGTILSPETQPWMNPFSVNADFTYSASFGEISMSMSPDTLYAVLL